MSNSEVLFEQTLSINEVDTLVKQILPILNKQPIMCLMGEVGTGKTTLTKALLAAMGYPNAVDSPTFNLVNTYQWLNQKVYHFDLYRINSIQELDEIGFMEYLDSGHICIIEWPEIILNYLDQAYLCLKINHQKDLRHYTLLQLN